MRWILLSCLCTLFQFSKAQGTGTWTSYLSYHNTTAVAEANHHVFAVANGSLYQYGKTDKSIKFYSKQEGLSDNNILLIGFNPEVNTLLIVYSNGNIDLLGEKGTYNLPYLLHNTHIQNKGINSIFFYKEYAYLSTNFGILVVNMRKNEITDTYKLDDVVFSSCIKDSYMYAVTSTGIRIASIKDNLLDIGNWNHYSLHTDLFNETDIRKIETFQNTLCFFIPDKGVYYQNSDKTIQSLCTHIYMKDMIVEKDKLLAYTEKGLYICYSLTQKIETITGMIKGISCQTNTDMYWIATGDDGLKAIKRKGTTNQMEVIVSDLITLQNSPKRNWATFLSHEQGKLMVAGGDRWLNRLFRPGTFMVYADRVWTNFDENKVQEEAHMEYLDVTSVAIDPYDPTHYFTSTWGEGVFEFKDNTLVTLHNTNNSTLVPAINHNNPSQEEKDHYVRVDGLCFDRQGNLWMTNTAVNSCINILKKDRTWTSFNSDPYKSLFNHDIVDKIRITSQGHKWVNILRPDSKIVVFDDKGTLDNTSDDIVNTYAVFNNQKGENIDVNGYYCIIEDKKGMMWIGTDRGPIICPVPNYAITNPSNLYCTRITRSLQEDIPVYFLDNTKVTAIAVDGGNRKWLGTEGSGIFLVSEDGMETLENFTTANSPILSDNIKSIAIDDGTGEIFFGTDQGIISYMGDANKGKEDYLDIYAYPNPVRPDYTGLITITGLMTDSNVKITDLNGNQIYQARSNGGILTWNGHAPNGNRVASGVYLVLASTLEAGESVVCKIMVIR